MKLFCCTLGSVSCCETGCRAGVHAEERCGTRGRLLREVPGVKRGAVGLHALVVLAGQDAPVLADLWLR